jgi:hypothetical protein
MSDLKEKIWKNLSKVKDLTEAILLLRQNVKKAEPLVPEEPKGELRHMGQYLGAPGYVTHVVGTGQQGAPHYKMTVNMAKLAEGEPHILVDLHGHDGKLHHRSPKMHGSIKEAIRDILSHFHNGDWQK